MHHVVNVLVYVILFTELACEGQAGEMLQPVPVDGIDIKPNDERREQPNVGQHRGTNEESFSVLVNSPKGDIGQEGKGEQQAAEEAKYVGNVVNPGQEAA